MWSTSKFMNANFYCPLQKVNFYPPVSMEGEHSKFPLNSCFTYQKMQRELRAVSLSDQPMWLRISRLLAHVATQCQSVKIAKEVAKTGHTSRRLRQQRIARVRQECVTLMLLFLYHSPL